MQRVEHANVVHFFESHYDTEKQIYFMMEFAEGRSPEQVLQWRA
jgi:hypothetical protein